MTHFGVLKAGSRIDRYMAVAPLGRGGMGEVWCVRHYLLETRHALKVLHLADPALRARLLREGRAQARLDHPHVVPVHDVFETPFGLALLMPLVDGPSLARLLEHRRPSPPEAAGLLRAVVSGVAAAHARGLVHRDLKPANVLLDLRSGRCVPRVSDFGLVRELEETEGITRAGTVLGTPAYAAPEQLDDAGTAGLEADRWSLGVIAFELLTGSRPFGTRLAEVRVAQRQAAPRPSARARELDPRWDAVVGGLLRVEPARRASLESLDTALEALGGSDDALGPEGELWLEVWGLRDEPPEAASSTVNVRASDPDPVAPRPHNLPRLRDAFVGRERELRELRDRIGAHRLVTITGTGGTGKTRLVSELVRSLASRSPGGVWFCDLTEARSLEGVVAAVARALEVPLGRDPSVQLGWAIDGRGRALLVLDNFEQVAEHASETVGRWLEATSEARFLVTSRIRLGLSGETLFPLDVLPVPAGDEEEKVAASDAVRLFVTRARQLDPTYDVGPAEVAELAALVRDLDGLPLALELAAARIRTMPLARIRARLSERFRLLVARGVDSDPRHRTLRATLDGSWDLLADVERSTLAQLSVFEGGFSVEAAEAVVELAPDAPWIEDVLGSLVDQSFLRPLGDGRLGLLVSVQAYARERLAQVTGVEAAEQRHGRFFAAMGAPEALDALDRHGGAPRQRALWAEIDNVMAAARRAVARGDGEVAAQAAAAVWTVVARRGPIRVAIELFEGVLSLPELPPLARARTLSGLGRAHCVGGDVEAGSKALSEALAGALAEGDRRMQAEIHARWSAILGDLRDDPDGLERHARAAVELGGTGWAAAIGMLALGVWLAARGAYEEATSIVERARALALRHGYSWAERNADRALGELLSDRGHDDEARRLLERAGARFRELGERRQALVIEDQIARLDARSGRLDEAHRRVSLCVAGAREMGIPSWITLAFGNLGIVELRQGRLEAARASLDEAVRVARSIGSAYHEALARDTLAQVEILEGHPGRARPHLEAALQFFRGSGRRAATGESLCSLAEAEHLAGRAEAAHEALAEAESIAAELGFTGTSDLGHRLAAARQRLGLPTAGGATGG
jgi:predicted ATPase/serine/threonine protein kinase